MDTRESAYREKHAPVVTLRYGAVVLTVTLGAQDVTMRSTAQHTVTLASQLMLRHFFDRLSAVRDGDTSTEWQQRYKHLLEDQLRAAIRMGVDSASLRYPS